MSKEFERLDMVLAEINGGVKESKRTRSVLARMIWDTRREMRRNWKVPPRWLYERVEVLREVGRELRK